jgi:hypothetical protein
MNKHYQKAIVAEALNQLHENGHEDVTFGEVWDLCKREYASSEAAGDADDNWGNFEDDVEFLVDTWEEENVILPEEKEDKSQEEALEEELAKLHVGFNFVPGIGFGYCRDEEDLDRMKDFVRGGMAISQMMSQLFG